MINDALHRLKRNSISVGVRLAAATLLMMLPPVMASPQSTTFHLAFDDERYLEQDYSHRIGTRSGLAHEMRELRLVDGVFGSALLNGRAFIQDDYDQTHMSVRDLDVTLSVIAHHRFKYYEKGLQVGWMEPYFWGTGRISPETGTVAFWAKGMWAKDEAMRSRHLFFQGTSSFGRFEKYLLGIDLLEDDSLEGWIVDARYDRHSVRTEPVWNWEEFNHVALAWDRGHGLKLYVNGEEAASNWGTDAWWTGQMPGLMHMPMSGLAYDELWVFDLALNRDQIQMLMKENKAPESSPPLPYDEEAIARLSEAFVGPSKSYLPTLAASVHHEVHRYREIYPAWAGDGAVRAPYVMDGQLALAWPQDYTSFTNILGDSDFHPEKVDFVLPDGNGPNHVSLKGDLSDVRLLEGSTGSATTYTEKFHVPRGRQFFHAQEMEPGGSRAYRIPFLKGYGSPKGYAEGLHLPQSGEMRIHDVSFYRTDTVKMDAREMEGTQWPLRTKTTEPLSQRYDYALRATTDGRSGVLLGFEEGHQVNAEAEWVDVHPMSRVNLISSPMKEDVALLSVLLDLNIRGAKNGDFMIVRLRDAGVPVRLWNELVFRLEGFDGDGGRLRLHLDCVDLRMPAGDRVLMDMLFESGAEVQIGSESGSAIYLQTGALSAAAPEYVHKAIQPALSHFAKTYYWYFPWIWAGDEIDFERLVSFGGQYDIMNYTLNAMRTASHHPIVSALYKLSLFEKNLEPSYNPAAWENTPEYWPGLLLSDVGGAPEWALYMRHYLTGLFDVVEWWAERQMPDGQVGGGWNDDVMFAGRLPGPLLYLEGNSSRKMFRKIFEGIDHTRMFHDGYCNIVPMDDIHAEDLVRNRYEGLLFNPGDPYMMTRAMRTGWRLGKPDETPANYHDGASFKYDHDVVQWYWGNTPAYEPYKNTRESVTEVAKRFAPAINDVIHFRYTDSGMFTDGFTFPGGSNIKEILIGGKSGPFLDSLTLSAVWVDGPGCDMPRWIEHASDTRFVAHVYSFAREVSEATVRLLRLKSGRYQITVEGVEGDAAAGVIFSTERDLNRFSTVSFPVYPGMELRLSVDLVEASADRDSLPDLAIGHVWRSGIWLKVEALNLGVAPAHDVKVRLLDETGRTVSTRRIPRLSTAEDFVPGVEWVEFSTLGIESSTFTVVIDPDGEHEEILEDNNRSSVTY